MDVNNIFLYTYCFIPLIQCILFSFVSCLAYTFPPTLPSFFFHLSELLPLTPPSLSSSTDLTHLFFFSLSNIFSSPFFAASFSFLSLSFLPSFLYLPLISFTLFTCLLFHSFASPFIPSSSHSIDALYLSSLNSFSPFLLTPILSSFYTYPFPPSFTHVFPLL